MSILHRKTERRVIQIQKYKHVPKKVKIRKSERRTKHIQLQKVNIETNRKS